MLTDSHCHLASHRFPPEEVPQIISRARAAGVDRLITLATCLEDLPQNLSIAENPAVHACIGIHPCDVHHAPDDVIERLADFSSDARVCAIGETGLDYYHPAPEGWNDETFRRRQRCFLRQHFELAATAKLNIVIHTRDREGFASFEDALGIYGDYHNFVRAVFHCFIGPWENARRVLNLGGIVSFGGVTTFKTAHEVRETAKLCPAGSFMVETDSPYLAPEPYRGKRNEPAYVLQTAERLAVLRGESLQALALHTNETAAGFFRLRQGPHE
jgi:TatD DNase family protein